MKKRDQKRLCGAVCFFALFILWTLMVSFVDVVEIGPEGSAVGLASFNRFFRDLVGVNMWLYDLTDWLGLVPIAMAFGFAIVGALELIRRKSLLKVDRGILLMGIFYVVLAAVYILFELLVINYRPVLIDGALEVSYPSSTTLLMLCVMPTAAMQLNASIKNTLLGRFVITAIGAFTVVCVIGRVMSGVHWITDIIGGLLLSSGLVMLYSVFFEREK